MVLLKDSFKNKFCSKQPGCRLLGSALNKINQVKAGLFFGCWGGLIISFTHANVKNKKCSLSAAAAAAAFYILR
jgi:hypothetical protein